MYAHDETLRSYTAVNFNNEDYALCSGKDFQTAECRGELCHIGKDDFDWALYLGLVFITCVCFAFGAALIYCAKRSMGNNSHYGITRTALDSDYMQGVDKKPIRLHVDTGNINYDYANLGQRYATDDHINYAIAEHHYDVPNLCTNYTNPIDELSMEYLTDTADTSTCTSNSIYDITSKLPSSSVSKKSTCKLSTAREIITSSGGCIRLYNGEIMLYIPSLAIPKNQIKHISFMVLSDDTAYVSNPCTDSFLVCSTIVYCSPSSQCFIKPVILKIPHCLINCNQWNVTIYHSENHHDDLNVSWRKISTIGQETINTPIFAQLDSSHAYLMTEQLGRYAIVADPKPGIQMAEISIKMKLFTFSQMTPNTCILRIYVVRDYPNSKDICSRIEAQLGGTYLGESFTFKFHLNNNNLKIRVRPIEANEVAWESQKSDIQDQVIPYNHIMSNNSILHCEFSLKRTEQYCMGVGFNVEFVQNDINEEGDHLKFSISSIGASSLDIATDKPTTISMDKEGNYVSAVRALENVQLPALTKRMICAALDPPRTDENDWRLLASKLNTDQYIAYFATKPSPTEQILNLLECRANNSSNTVFELIASLKEMKRKDVIDIIEQTIGQQWI